MAGNNQTSSDYDFNAKWDACVDLSLRRVAYSSLAGAFGGLLLFRSPVSRWASIAFGAGVGFGSAYSECSQLFNKPSERSTLTPLSASSPLEVSKTSVSEVWLRASYAAANVRGMEFRSFFYLFLFSARMHRHERAR